MSWCRKVRIKVGILITTLSLNRAKFFFFFSYKFWYSLNMFLFVIGHYVIICGYDTLTDEFEIRDPASTRYYLHWFWSSLFFKLNFADKKKSHIFLIIASDKSFIAWTFGFIILSVNHVLPFRANYFFFYSLLKFLLTYVGSNKINGCSKHVRISSHCLEEARKSFGTDEDLLLVIQLIFTRHQTLRTIKKIILLFF